MQQTMIFTLTISFIWSFGLCFVYWLVHLIKQIWILQIPAIVYKKIEEHDNEHSIPFLERNRLGDASGFATPSLTNR